jgi:ribose 5-phosphate isomerase B
MKRFDIITEVDARALGRGETVALSRNGHVTPLAADTLRERRVTVVRDGKADGPDDSLVPSAPVASVAIGSDHTGVALRRVLTAFLRGRGLVVSDLGPETADPVDYPDVAASVGRAVARKEVDAGIVIDGAGIGSAIAANKIDGVRAAMGASETIARYAREHNGANVLTLGATLVTPDEAKAIVTAWLAASTREPRYLRRIAKIRQLEADRRRGGGAP